MKHIIYLMLMVLPSMSYSQGLNQKTTDPEKNNEMLVGYCNRDGFESINSNFDSVYKAEYLVFQADKETMKQLDGKLKDIDVTIVMATWCGDSKDWVPRFYKILDEVNFNYENLTLICVDRNKKAPGTTHETLKVERVPTFIFYRNNKELGRIIEVPTDLLEKDILKIVSKQE